MDSRIKYVRYEKGKPWHRGRYPATLRGELILAEHRRLTQMALTTVGAVTIS